MNLGAGPRLPIVSHQEEVQEVFDQLPIDRVIQAQDHGDRKVGLISMVVDGSEFGKGMNYIFSDGGRLVVFVCALEKETAEAAHALRGHD